MRRVADVSPATSATRHPPAPTLDPLARARTLANSVIYGTRVAKLAPKPVRWILAWLCRGRARIRMTGGTHPQLAGFSLAGRGNHPRRNVLMAVAPAPAQYVPRVFTAPPVDNLGRHLQPRAVLTAVLDERAEIIDQFRGGVIAHMRRAGERFVINGPARRDGPGQTRSGRAPAFAEICMDSRNMRRAAG